MSPLKRLFGSRTAKPAQAEQRDNLAGKPQAELLAMVQGKGQETLREAAVQYLDDIQTLLTLALNEHNHRLQLAARKRLGELLEQGQLTLEPLRQASSDEAQLLTLASYSPSAGEQLLAQISDPTLLLELASQGASIQIRRAAAEKITDRTQLEQLAKAAQGRDKTVYKLARQRLEAFKAEDARLAEHQAQALVICEKLEHLSRAKQDPQFDAKLNKLQADWSALQAYASADTRERHQKALEQCRQLQADWARAQEEQEAEAQDRDRDRESAQTQHQALDNQFKTLLLELLQADDATLAQTDFSQRLANLDGQLKELAQASAQRDLTDLQNRKAQLETLLNRLQSEGSLTHWLTQAQTGASQGAHQESQNQALKHLKLLLKPARQLPEGDRPELVTQALQWVSEQECKQTEAERSRHKNLRELERLARQGLAAARRGQVRRARGLDRAAWEKREQLASVPKTLAELLEKLDAAIANLSDWHEFAVTPKKQALIEAMRKLEHSRMAPDQLARKIHHLQDDWREVSKGVPHHDEDLWHEFQEASHRAFEPCKEFFEAQARERQANQSKREELIEQLKVYLRDYHWDRPVWKDVEQTLKTARREWRDAWPVPRQAIKEQEARFEPLMDELYGKLGEAYEARRARKAALVERARELTELSDLSDAIASAKQLQADWKTIGPCRPKDDRTLWKQFRGHCDAIFERRQEIFEAADQERKAQAEQAQAIIGQLKQLARDSADRPKSSKSQVAELKSAFQALDKLPRERAQGLQRDFQNALKTLEQQQKRAKAKAREQEQASLFAAAEALRQLELAYLSGTDTQAAREQAEVSLDGIEHWPGDSHRILQQRLEQVSALSSGQQEQNLKALRLLCIRAEILQDQDSPEDDKPLRMSYQMQQLQTGLGKPDDSAQDLLQEWLSLPAVPDPDYTKLLHRFQKTIHR